MFLTTSLQRFRQYTEHFQTQEKEHQEIIQKAKDALMKAKEAYHSTKEKPPKATVISDDEAEMKDGTTGETATRILEGLTNMQDGLQKLSAQAEEEHNAAEERKAKRPRNKPEEPAEAANAFTSPSMQPFGAPGQG